MISAVKAPKNYGSWVPVILGAVILGPVAFVLFILGYFVYFAEIFAPR